MPKGEVSKQVTLQKTLRALTGIRTGVTAHQYPEYSWRGGSFHVYIYI